LQILRILGIVCQETRLQTKSISISHLHRILFYCFYSVCFWLFETGCHYVAQGAIKRENLLPQRPRYWDYRCALSHLSQIFVVLAYTFSPVFLTEFIFGIWCEARVQIYSHIWRYYKLRSLALCDFMLSLGYRCQKWTELQDGQLVSTVLTVGKKSPHLEVTVVSCIGWWERRGKQFVFPIDFGKKMEWTPVTLG
jgi:hypothetical protein